MLHMFDDILSYFGKQPKSQSKVELETPIHSKLFDDVVKQIPSGWFVFELGQNPAHMLWFCQLILFDSLYVDPDVPESERRNYVKRVFIEECDTATIALSSAIEKIKNEDFIGN